MTGYGAVVTDVVALRTALSTYKDTLVHVSTALSFLGLLAVEKVHNLPKVSKETAEIVK